MNDKVVRVNLKHRDKFIEIIDMLDNHPKYKYFMSEKMNGTVVINFIKDIDSIINDFPKERDFFSRLRNLIKKQNIQEPRKILIYFKED